MCIPHLVIEPILPKNNTKYWFATVSKEKTSEEEKLQKRKARVSIKRFRKGVYHSWRIDGFTSWGCDTTGYNCS